MAVESPIDEDAEVFVGEHKVLRWTVRDAARYIVDISPFTMRLSLFQRRNPVPLATVPATVADGPGGVAVATLTAEQSLLLGPGAHRYVLARIDAGSEAVLAYGSIVLKGRAT